MPCLLQDDSEVGEGDMIRNCVAGSGSCSQSCSRVLDDCVPGDSVFIGEKEDSLRVANIWTGKDLEPNTISF